jgi:DNA polymerase III subunit delta'
MSPLASIVGHRRVVDLLRQAVAHQRVPQSLLFAGPAGVGKHAVALALAQAVNCPNQRDGDGCGTCATCRRIARGQHSDMAVVDTGGEASIKIAALRAMVLDVAGYRPFEAARRVFVIDPADALTIEAQDALLKTLEEPPSATVLILVTAFPDGLRATIQSRCRRLRFGPLSEQDVARVLVEQCGVASPRAGALAAASGGSVERALAEQTGELADDREAAFGLLAAAARGRGVAARLTAAAALVQHGSGRRDRAALEARLAMTASLVRDLAVLETGSPIPLANADFGDRLRELAGAFGLQRISAAFDAIREAETALDRNASPKIVADWLALRT